jgi:hypothetical protein
MAPEREGSNGFDAKQLDKFLREIDKADDELASLKSAHMEACKQPRGWLRDTMATAKEAGLNMTAFRAVVAEHRAERKIEQRLAELEADDAADYEAMLEALGGLSDMPLGEAALSKAKKPKHGDSEKLDGLRA